METSPLQGTAPMYPFKVITARRVCVVEKDDELNFQLMGFRDTRGRC